MRVRMPFTRTNGVRVLIPLLLVGTLTGCTGGVAIDDFDRLAELKQECEDAGGVFETWLNSGAIAPEYGYECDMSTKPKKDR